MVLRTGGVDRSYLVARPAGRAPAPLIVLLHGLGSNAEGIDKMSDVPRRGADAGAVVVTPNAVGTPRLWQASASGPDAAFLDALITTVEARDCIDTRRVGVVGFSVGALFASAYACAHEDRIAAVVTVELDVPGPCTEPMPILAFHATGDPIVAYAPPPGSTPLGGGSGTEANLTQWARLSHCVTNPTTAEVDRNVTRLVWPLCSRGSDVILYKILGGGHSWPSNGPKFNATNEAVAFLTAHSLRP